MAYSAALCPALLPLSSVGHRALSHTPNTHPFSWPSTACPFRCARWVLALGMAWMTSVTYTVPASHAMAVATGAIAAFTAWVASVDDCFTTATVRPAPPRGPLGPPVLTDRAWHARAVERLQATPALSFGSCPSPASGSMHATMPHSPSRWGLRRWTPLPMPHTWPAPSPARRLCGMRVGVGGVRFQRGATDMGRSHARQAQLPLPPGWHTLAG